MFVTVCSQFMENTSATISERALKMLMNLMLFIIVNERDSFLNLKLQLKAMNEGNSQQYQK